MYATLKRRIDAWVFQSRGPEKGAVTLVQRRVYILPTRGGLTFVVVLVLMLLGSINYTLSLGFVLTFLLGAMGVNTMIHTFRNLARLRISAGRVSPVFAGDEARFTLAVENPSDFDRYNIAVTWQKREPMHFDVAARRTMLARVSVPAPRRGILRPGRFTLFTEFPLGLYQAWSYVHLDMYCTVYPKPAPPGIPLPRTTVSGGRGADHGRGDNDFAGLRQYHPGDSPRHIAWKAAARDRGLLTKQFSGNALSQLWLAWDQTPPMLSTEDRLSRLARWVLDAEAEGLSYGLRLPGKVVPLGAGDAQRERCLEALAMHEIDDDSRPAP